MKKTNKILSIILAILMIATTIPMAFAADIVDSGTFGADGDNLTWMFDSDGVLTISGEGAMGMKDISTTLESDYPWYAYASSINTVIINEGVTKIGNSAFYDYMNLSSVSLPNSLTYIDDFAFRGCSKLKEIVLPIGVTYIGWNVFRLCYGLEDVVMSYTMEKIDSYAFGNEINIKTVHYLGTEEQWDKINFIDDGSGNEILINAERHYCEKIAGIEATCTTDGVAIWYCSTCSKAVADGGVIPASHTIESVEAKAPTCTEIGWDAYEYCTACDYTTYNEIPATNHKDTLVEVEAKANTCTEIGWDAYEYCTVCDYTTYVEKAALDHDIVIDAYVAPKCEETGLTAGQHCSRCDDMTIVQEVIPDLGGHINEDGNTTCDRCGETLLCEDCGRPVHEDTFVQNLVCLIVMLINLIKTAF